MGTLRIDDTLLLGVALVWLTGQVIFNGFEKHLSVVARLTKLIILLAATWLISGLAGRSVALIVLGGLATISLLLHFTVFPQRGIHPFSAEPYGEYTRWLNRCSRRGGPWSEFPIIRILRRERWGRKRRTADK